MRGGDNMDKYEILPLVNILLPFMATGLRFVAIEESEDISYLVLRVLSLSIRILLWYLTFKFTCCQFIVIVIIEVLIICINMYELKEAEMYDRLNYFTIKIIAIVGAWVLLHDYYL